MTENARELLVANSRTSSLEDSASYAIKDITPAGSVENSNAVAGILPLIEHLKTLPPDQEKQLLLDLQVAIGSRLDDLDADTRKIPEIIIPSSYPRSSTRLKKMLLGQQGESASINEVPIVKDTITGALPSTESVESSTKKIKAGDYIFTYPPEETFTENRLIEIGNAVREACVIDSEGSLPELEILPGLSFSEYKVKINPPVRLNPALYNPSAVEDGQTTPILVDHFVVARSAPSSDRTLTVFSVDLPPQDVHFELVDKKDKTKRCRLNMQLNQQKARIRNFSVFGSVSNEEGIPLFDLEAQEASLANAFKMDVEDHIDLSLKPSYPQNRYQVESAVLIIVADGDSSAYVPEVDCHYEVKTSRQEANISGDEIETIPSSPPTETLPRADILSSLEQQKNVYSERPNQRLIDRLGLAFTEEAGRVIVAGVTLERNRSQGAGGAEVYLIKKGQATVGILKANKLNKLEEQSKLQSEAMRLRSLKAGVEAYWLDSPYNQEGQSTVYVFKNQSGSDVLISSGILEEFLVSDMLDLSSELRRTIEDPSKESQIRSQSFANAISIWNQVVDLCVDIVRETGGVNTDFKYDMLRSIVTKEEAPSASEIRIRMIDFGVFKLEGSDEEKLGNSLNLAFQELFTRITRRAVNSNLADMESHWTIAKTNLIKLKSELIPNQSTEGFNRLITFMDTMFNSLSRYGRSNYGRLAQPLRDVGVIEG